ncbi:MAG: xanthine dehydrogenase [Syntrophomonadaceae bacterium]|jgi:xanthine dehydrogenase accessory factor|nr:xanthine dehydrogenase [Syntrophomonadaceae bacterium]
MKELQEQMAVITVIKQENLNDGLIGQKAIYIQGQSEGISIPWIKAKLEELVQISLSAGSLKVTSIINQDKPEQKVTVMIEPCLLPEELVILGGGHIAKPLAKVAKLLGFKVVVLDDRPGFASKERFPDADQLFTMPFDRIHEVLELGARSHVVIVTQGHRHDWVCMQQVLKFPFAYLGVIGSKRKIALTKEKMMAEGFDPSKINNIYMPIGIDIGAETPEEIAISIAAELIKVRYGGKAASLSGNNNLAAKSPDQSTDAQFDLIQKAANLAKHETPAAVATIYRTEGSTPRKAGSRMIIKDDGTIYGTIGGGKGEAMVCEEAKKIIESERPGIFQVDMNADMLDELGMICGGSITVFIEPVKSFAGAFKEGRLE